jgi:RNA polymerase sigma-70 factor (ECF subfamily)
MCLIQVQDQTGLTQLHNRHGKFLKGLGMKVLHNDADAEDLVQEVFLEIWRSAVHYHSDKGRPLSWIATITSRRAIDRLRRRQVYGHMQERFTEAIEGHSHSWSHVRQDVQDRERNVYLLDAVARLPEAQQRALKLAYYGQMSQREVAAHTGVPLGTVKTRLQLALSKMAVFLHAGDELR